MRKVKVNVQSGRKVQPHTSSPNPKVYPIYWTVSTLNHRQSPLALEGLPPQVKLPAQSGPQPEHVGVDVNKPIRLDFRHRHFTIATTSRYRSVKAIVGHHGPWKDPAALFAQCGGYSSCTSRVQREEVCSLRPSAAPLKVNRPGRVTR